MLHTETMLVLLRSIMWLIVSYRILCPNKKNAHPDTKPNSWKRIYHPIKQNQVLNPTKVRRSEQKCKENLVVKGSCIKRTPLSSLRSHTRLGTLRRIPEPNLDCVTVKTEVREPVLFSLPVRLLITTTLYVRGLRSHDVPVYRFLFTS